MQNTNNDLTKDTLKRFLEYAEDAGNWDGFPVVGHNVGGDAQDNGYLTSMKKKGYIETDTDEGALFITFTEKGIELAKENGIEL